MARVPERLLTLLLAATLALTSAAASSKPTYRWLDPNGDVQFGEAPPAGVPYWISYDGAIWKPMQPDGNAEPEEPESRQKLTPEERRAREDNLLRVKYRDLGDIEQARQVELEYVRLDEHTERKQIRSLLESLFERLRNAADRQRAGLSVDAPQRRQIEGIRIRLVKGERSLRALRDRREAIEDRYDADEKRYRELMGISEPGP
jgi:hypothetical protein